MAQVVTALLLGALLAQPGGPTAPAAPPAADSTSARVRAVPRDQRAPVRYQGQRLILFEAKIAGRDVLAILDTGAERSAMDVGLARDAGLAVADSAGRAVTPSGAMQAWTVDDVPILIPGQFELQHPRLAALDLSGMAPEPGRRVGFILGRDILGSTALVVDPVQRTFQLGPSGAFNPPPGSAQAVDLRPGQAQFTLTITGQPVLVNVDTGFDGHLALSPSAWDRLVPKDAPVESGSSRDAAGRERPTRQARLPEVMVGPLRATNLPVRDIPRVSHGAQGDVGLGLLSRFRFALDIRAGKLWLAPILGAPPPAP